MPAPHAHTLRLILGDQLHAGHSWFREPDHEVLYVLMELLPETRYVKHHIQKVAAFFLAMRDFAAQLQARGFNVHYFRLDDPENTQSFEGNIRLLMTRHQCRHFAWQLPDEYRLDLELRTLGQTLEAEGFQTQTFDTEHFMAPRNGVADCFRGRKTYLMEHFYRQMRMQYQLLMEPDGRTPLGGRWNFDAENRRKLPAGMVIPSPMRHIHDARSIADMLTRMGVETMGFMHGGQLDACLNRKEALELLDHFLRFRLPLFGVYQDAMTQRDTLLFHSRLSFALNVKLITPLEVVQLAIQYWQSHQQHISIAQIEGFVRQIIGWREYMRGIYWAEMPAYAQLNFFDHQAPLPSWYWTGNTRMNCLRHAIGQSLETAYAHHIQRLMVTGAFALLLGVHPDETDAWYLGIYLDALEWVEMPNTRGMSQYADGGRVGTKPYVGAANYIDKMSDYCRNCHYDKSKRCGPGACPFNSLYWDFYLRHRDKLAHNPRIGMVYPALDRMSEAARQEIREQAALYRAQAETL